MMPATAAALTTSQIDYRARAALEFAFAGAPEMPPETDAPVIYAGIMAAAYTGIAAALHMGDGYDPQETANIGAVSALETWRDTAAEAAVAFAMRHPDRPRPQDWRQCYAIPMYCSHREPSALVARRCPDDAAYIAIRRDDPGICAGWCDAHIPAQLPPDLSPRFAIYPARQSETALRNHILLHSLESLAIGGEDDDDDLIAQSNAARLLAGEIRAWLAALEMPAAKGG